MPVCRHDVICKVVVVDFVVRNPNVYGFLVLVDDGLGQQASRTDKELVVDIEARLLG